MATFRLRRFSSPEILRAIAPARLLAFLKPHREFFASQQFILPQPGAAEEVDYEGLVHLFMSHDTGLPKALLDALFLVDEMSSPAGMDVLLEAARRRGLDLEEGAELSPADVAVQCWRLAPDLLERKHAEQYALKRRSFEHYQTDRAIPPFTFPSAADLRALERSLEAWFETKKRGCGVRVFAYEQKDGAWFLVRHGEPFKREESLDGGKPASVFYRPLRYDVILYHPVRGELRINARSKGERQLYQRQFGRLLFGDEFFFPGTGKYTLEPLRATGPAALVCADVDGIEWVLLREVHCSWDGRFHETEGFKADDVFAALEERGEALPTTGWLSRAVFQIKFTDSRTPRSVTIRPSNVAQYTRDSDAALVEEWLTKRGFLEAERGAAHETVGKTLASA